MKKQPTRCTIAMVLLATAGTAFAAGGPAGPAGHGANTMAPHAPVMLQVMSEETICPAPYTKSTAGYDVSKGESQCIKSAATCPDGYVSQRNDQNGQLTCTPAAAMQAPVGWSAGPAHGVYVFNSIPQPMVKCPKATKDWQWGTRYFTESWNRMGCIANPKPAY